MSRSRVLAILLLLACAGAVPARDFYEGQDDVAVSHLRTRRERASRYLVARARFTAPDGYHEAAAAALEAARGALAGGAYKDAYRIAWRAYRRQPYSTSAADLLDVFIRAATLSGRHSHAANYLIDLWYRFPGHAGIDDLLRTTLAHAEDLQNPQRAIDWSADDPASVIDRSAAKQLFVADAFFRFLAEHGDRHTVAPRAALGLARSILISGYRDRQRLAEARIAYMDLLQAYPDSELVFTALCELALCHLLGFRGDRFDGGVLSVAEQFIDQAELYTQDIPERNQLIDRYRDLVIRWRQDKDYQVARWYERRGQAASAVYYYRAAIALDSASDQARRARQAIARLEGAQVGDPSDDRP